MNIVTDDAAAKEDQAPKSTALLNAFQKAIDKAKKNLKDQHDNYKIWQKAAAAKNKPKKDDNRVYPYLIESVISSLIPIHLPMVRMNGQGNLLALNPLANVGTHFLH